MSDKLALDLDKLHDHATAVGAIADDVSSALSAVRSGDVVEGAFGLMCSFLVAPTSAMTAAAAGMLGAKERLLLRTASQLHATVAQWHAVEQNLGDTVRDFRNALES